MASTDRPKPLYRRIGDELMDRVRSGSYPVGTDLPTEVELAKEFDTTRFTIRGALHHLETSRMITRRQGSGSRVISDRPLDAYSLAVAEDEDLLRYGVETRADWKLHDRQAPQLLAQRLGLESRDDWLWLSNVRRAGPERKKIGYSNVVIRRAFAAAAHDFGQDQPGTLFERIRDDHGVRLLFIDHTIEATILSPRLARLLSAESGSPALRIVRQFVADDGPFEVTETTYPADRFSYGLRLHRESERGAESSELPLRPSLG